MISCRRLIRCFGDKGLELRAWGLGFRALELQGVYLAPSLGILWGSMVSLGTFRDGNCVFCAAHPSLKPWTLNQLNLQFGAGGGPKLYQTLSQLNPKPTP